MKASQVLQQIQEAVAEVRAQNQEVISVAAFEAYLAELATNVDSTHEYDRLKHEADLAHFRAQHESALAHYRATSEVSLEMHRSVISYGQAALKSSILINGGAAVALLAVVGQLWRADQFDAAITGLTEAVLALTFGVLSGAVATASTYVTQYFYSESRDADEEDAQRRKERVGKCFHWATVALVVLAYILFAIGATRAYGAFSV